MPKLGRGGIKKKSRPFEQTQPEVYGKVKWMATSERVNFLFFFASFFQNISKTAETILTEKIGRNHDILVYKKALINEHRKNYIFRDNNCFVKMSASLLVNLSVCTLPNFCGRANSKTSVNIKTKLHT